MLHGDLQNLSIQTTGDQVNTQPPGGINVEGEQNLVLEPIYYPNPLC
jgi:hypothetical protein